MNHSTDQTNTIHEQGFSLLEIAIVMVVIGLLSLPLVSLNKTRIQAQRNQKTEDALTLARDALIAYAARHNGCLPFAADFEGGLPDTNAAGNGGYTDTGAGILNQRAGDIPWLDLGLGNQLLDGGGYRLQYYVASQYTATTTTGRDCQANARTDQTWWPPQTWNAATSYAGGTVVIYLGNYYRATAATTPGIAPNVGGGWNTTPVNLTANLLEYRRGPNVNGAAPQNNVISSQNVFVLIAADKNLNPTLNRRYVRDNSHTVAALNTANVNTALFAQEHFAPGAANADTGSEPDDTIRVVSYNMFQALLNKYNLVIAPIAY